MDIGNLSKLFSYKEGKLYWKVNRSGMLGKEAGWLNCGYLKVGVDGKNYLLHRVIFAMQKGYLPEFIDHIDGNRLNNNIENLRAATKSQNQSNCKLHTTNKSGVKGVSWKSKNNAWVVQISKEGKKIHIGLFKDFELAELVAKEARDKYHGEFSRDY